MPCIIVPWPDSLILPGTWRNTSDFSGFPCLLPVVANGVITVA